MRTAGIHMATCSRGHEWHVAAGDSVAACPVCGESVPSNGTLHVHTPKPASSSRTFIESDRATSPSGEPVSFLPGYEILGEIGRGGMGVVYKARQLSLNRIVAVKMILAGMHASPGKLARFRTEAEAIARLHHPNIVQVHELGEVQSEAGGPSRPYMVLEYMDGGSLAEHLAGKPQPIPDSARLVATLARAMHYAHQCGIIHRDLKPANVLLLSGGVVSGEWSTSSSENLADSSPPTTHHSPLTTHQIKISDFGLAKLLQQDSKVSETGDVIGTASYMAPEQAWGKSKVREIGPPTDVYALGAILYELLTGQPPFQGESVFQTLEQLWSRDPISPRRLRREVPRDLEVICLKCLEKEPAKRYATAATLADDVDRFLNDEPIQARAASPWERLSKWARRRPLVATQLVLLLVLLMGGVTGILWQWRRAEVHLSEAERQRRQAEENFEQARLAVDTLTWAAEAKLGERPGFQDLQRELLQTTLAYYQHFVKQRHDDSTMRIELARAYHRMGRINGVIGTSEESAKGYLQALAILEALAAENPADQDVQIELAGVCVNMLPALGGQGRSDEAFARLHQARVIWEQLIQDPATHPRTLSELGKTYTNIGFVLVDRGQLSEALAYQFKAKEVQERLIRDYPTLVQYLGELATTHFNIAGCHDRRHEYAEADYHFEQALLLQRELLRKQPNKEANRFDYAQLNLLIGDRIAAWGRPAKALPALLEARDEFERIGKANPQVHRTQLQLAQAHTRIGVALTALFRTPEATQSLEAAVKIWERLEKQDHLAELAAGQHQTHYALGQVHAFAGRKDDALNAYERARTWRERIVRARPSAVSAHGELGMVCNQVGAVLESLDRPEDALKRYRQASVEFDFCVERAPEVTEYRRLASNTLINLARLLRQLARPTEAVAATRQRAKLWPGNGAELYAVACELAVCLPLLQDSTQANSTRNEALALLRQALANGFATVARLKSDTDLDSLRKSEEFQKLLREAEEQAKGKRN